MGDRRDPSPFSPLISLRIIIVCAEEEEGNRKRVTGEAADDSVPSTKHAKTTYAASDAAPARFD